MWNSRLLYCVVWGPEGRGPFFEVCKFGGLFSIRIGSDPAISYCRVARGTHIRTEYIRTEYTAHCKARSTKLRCIVPVHDLCGIAGRDSAGLSSAQHNSRRLSTCLSARSCKAGTYFALYARARVLSIQHAQDTGGQREDRAERERREASDER